MDENLNKQNIIAKEIGELFKQGKKAEADSRKNDSALLKEDSKKLEADLGAAEKELTDILVRVPNVPHASVPKGNSPEENENVKQFGEIPVLPGNALAHWDIGKKVQNFSTWSTGCKNYRCGLSGLQRQRRKIERALVSFFLDKAIEAGYYEVIPPHMVNKESAFATGQLPDKEGQMFYIPRTDFI